ncbi:PREDICTED: uncharacterized protein LOC109149207 [Ipomoea nil]|uniref:uncharacterized protein LOC109149207 n=1 Tax=Ipomoea nil TaxID=35883 RepID=UPI00090133CE|nr:PREDICTED: uncharacterized protein LOC109149207 [Ipomoea nil]
MIKVSDQDDSVFLKNMFKFKDFGSLKVPGCVDGNKLIDLIGRVVSIHEPKVIQVNKKPQRLIDFVIEDCGLPRFFTPIRSISSSSRIIGSGSLEAMLNEIITVTSLKDIHDEKKVGEFWVFGEIIDFEHDWYFTACRNKGCGKKPQETEDKMYCKSCDKQWSDGIIKYRLVIAILDDDQDGQLLLWDNVCSSLLGITASELKVKYSEEGCMPNEIKELLGKTMKFRIVTRQEQFNYRGNVAFTVLGVKNGERYDTLA